MSDLVKRLREGTVLRPKRWSGDTHYDLGGSIDEDATDQLMDKAADHIEAQAARIERLEAALRPFSQMVVRNGSEVVCDVTAANILYARGVLKENQS